MCDIGDILGLSSDIIFPSYANIGLHKLQVNMERIAQFCCRRSSKFDLVTGQHPAINERPSCCIGRFRQVLGHCQRLTNDCFADGLVSLVFAVIFTPT